MSFCLELKSYSSASLKVRAALASYSLVSRQKHAQISQVIPDFHGSTWRLSHKMHQVSLCKNLRSKEGSDKRGKSKLSFMDCHIKIGELEFWVIPLRVCDCDPALGAGNALAMEPTCVSTLRQLEAAAVPQLITKPLSSASPKRNTENAISLWHCLHTQQRGGRPSTEFQAVIFILPEWN